MCGELGETETGEKGVDWESGVKWLYTGDVEDFLHMRRLCHRSFLYLEGYLLNRLSDNAVVMRGVYSSLNQPYPWAEEAVGARVEE